MENTHTEKYIFILFAGTEQEILKTRDLLEQKFPGHFVNYGDAPQSSSDVLKDISDYELQTRRYYMPLELAAEQLLADGRVSREKLEGFRWSDDYLYYIKFGARPPAKLELKIWDRLVEKSYPGRGQCVFAVHP